MQRAICGAASCCSASHAVLSGVKHDCLHAVPAEALHASREKDTDTAKALALTLRLLLTWHGADLQAQMYVHSLSARFGAADAEQPMQSASLETAESVADVAADKQARSALQLAMQMM
eukprot:GHRQ01040175.1.p3 GENE.GHRQ01040175.1~~GHRQ01040175.1.p3  ORF type:complete len:118 (+),score=25.90 GHRQ01040175.1:74-427(+)